MTYIWHFYNIHLQIYHVSIVNPTTNIRGDVKLVPFTAPPSPAGEGFIRTVGDAGPYRTPHPLHYVQHLPLKGKAKKVEKPPLWWSGFLFTYLTLFFCQHKFCGAIREPCP